MNNISCEIIQDLLPLYCDGVCSEESKKAIHTHIQTCDKCREELRVLNLPIDISEKKEEVDAAKAASKAWKKNRRKAFRLGILLAVLIMAGAIVAFLTSHYMQTVAVDDMSGMEQWMEAFAEVDHIDVKNTAQKGDYLAVSGCDEKGLWYVEILTRDMIFRDRWKDLGGLHKVKPGNLAGWKYKITERDTIFVCFGAELSDETKGYMFENDGITYSCPVEENSVLDFFFISGSFDSGIHLEPVYE